MLTVRGTVHAVRDIFGVLSEALSNSTDANLFSSLRHLTVMISRRFRNDHDGGEGFSDTESDAGGHEEELVDDAADVVKAFVTSMWDRSQVVQPFALEYLGLDNGLAVGRQSWYEERVGVLQLFLERHQQEEEDWDVAGSIFDDR